MYETVKIVQKNGIMDKQTISLISNVEVEIANKGLFNHSKYKIPMELFNPDPLTYQKLNIKAFFISMACLVVLALVSYSWIMLPTEKSAAPVTIVIALSAFSFSLYFMSILVRTSREMLIYFNSENANQVVRIIPGCVVSGDLEEFKSELTRRAKSIKHFSGWTKEQQFEVYFRHLEFLFQWDVITEAEFKNIVQRLKERKKPAEVISIVKD